MDKSKKEENIPLKRREKYEYNIIYFFPINKINIFNSFI